MIDLNLEYKGKRFHLSSAAREIMADKFRIDIEQDVKKVIDLFIDAEMDFLDIQLFVSESNNGNYILNFMEMN